MSRLNQSLPRYRKHKASGQAVVHLSGEDFYLGPYGSKASKLEYKRVISEWLQRGGTPLNKGQSEPPITQILVAYMRFAKSYYRKDGKPTSQLGIVKRALTTLRELYGHRPASEFGPLALQAVRQKIVDSGVCRDYVNKQVTCIKQMFKWAASQELVTADIFHALQTVSGLKKGRTEAPDHDPVEPVPEPDIEGALANLSPIIADMVRFERLTGSRPGEVCQIRPCDLDRSEDVWLYRPESHKTEHHGKQRVIPVGPKAQEILTPYLDRREDKYCFSPIEAKQWQLDQRSKNRKTERSYGNRPGPNRKANPKRQAKPHYTTDSYRKAIQRASERAKIDRWAPNQLRHNAATNVRAEFDLNSSRCILGHSDAKTAEIYARRDLTEAIEVARKVG